MNDSHGTQLLPALLWRDPRIHPLDDTWLLTIFTILPAIALPRFVSGVDIDFAATAVGLLGLGAIHLCFTALSSRATRNPLRLTRTLSVLHTLGVITVAFIWQHAGGVQNPLFLMVFALPVIGATFLSRWQPYFVAALAAVMVALMASSQAPELRWYAPAGLSAAADWLSGVLVKATGAGSLPFASFYAPSAYFVVLLEAFVTMLFACAVAAEYLGSIFERLQGQVSAARAETARSQALWSALLEQLPLPAVLLDANTHEVMCVSAPAMAKFFGGEESIVGRDFFQAIHFSYPEAVQQLINGAGGVERLSMVRLGDQLLATEVRVQHLAQRGRRFALVIVNDTTEAFCLGAALDVAEHAALVADSQGRVLAFNRPARALFSGTAVGAEVSRLLPQFDSGTRWWDPGLSGRRKMHVTVMRRVYQLTTSSVPLPGEDAKLYVIAFLPVARVAAADQTPVGSTTVVERP
ncbi:MAG TPA: PAS domain-containing protein [Steroidobacteraceae bacterium]|nr:PAS domain-containing protein [Steroidobacteraceae bacterium]